MRIFKNKAFHAWTQSIELEDDALVQAVQDMVEGLCEASLGGNVYKKRIALNGRGKSGGVRTIIAYHTEKRAVFMYGFAKNKRDNITQKELAALKYLAKIYFSYDENQIQQAINLGELVEVMRK